MEDAHPTSRGLTPVDLVAAALMVILGAIGPGGLLVVYAAALLLHLNDLLGDIRDAREARQHPTHS